MSPSGPVANTGRWLKAALEARAQRDFERAQGCLAQATREAAGDARALALVGDVQSKLADYPVAYAAYDAALALAPTQSALWFNRAAVARFLGRLDAAEADYDEAIRLAPSDAQAYLNRSDLRTQTPARNHAAALEQLFADGVTHWSAQVAAGYALAKEYEDLGRYDASWATLVAAAALRRRHLQYDPAIDLATVDWLIDAFPDQVGATLGSPSDEPIFVVGMPRTGSTLLERMIGAHSAVTAAGELADLGTAIVAAARARLGRDGSRRELVYASAGLDFAALGADYLARTRPRTGHRAYFIDKLPLNYLYCGLIARALPNARIVHMTRHPLATCYGAFKVLFDQGYPFSYELIELADYYAGYRRLMAHWRTLMPQRLIEVAYEDLVAQPQAECRRVLAGRGLTFEPACLEPHLNPAPSATASASQIRRPVYTTAVEQWRHYQRGLAPLKARLESHGVECP